MLSLSVDSINEVIDNVLASVCSTPSHRSWDDKDIILRRVTTADEWKSLLSSASSLVATNNCLSDNIIHPPYYFGIQSVASSDQQSQPDYELVGFCTFYIAYSTWDGRMLYVDQIDSEADDSRMLYHVLANIATRIGCARFSWKEKERPQWNYGCTDPEYLEDWLFLSMNRLAMVNFVGSTISTSSVTADPNEGNSKAKPLHRIFVEEVIRETLQQQMTSANVKLRLAGPEDTDTIARLVQLLAIYEKEPDAVNMGVEDYLLDGYNSLSEPLFYCILADITSTDEASKVDGKMTPSTTTTAAMGLFYFGHSMVDGNFLYLEDLFCDESFRGRGLGTAIMKQLAHISLALDCCQFIWTALDWNTPALSFYNKIGATLKDDMKITRYCGKELQAFAKSQAI